MPKRNRYRHNLPQTNHNAVIKSTGILFRPRVILLFLLLILACAGLIVKTIDNQHPAGWKYVTGEEITQQKAIPREFHTMTVHGPSIYFGVGSGFTYSLNRITGTLQWQHEAQDYSIYPAAFGSKNRVFVSNFDGGVYAIDRISGDELWRFRIPDYYKVDTEPIASGGFVYFGGRNGTLYALEEEAGKIRWTFQEAPLDIAHYTPDQVILHFGRFSVDDENIYLNSSTDNSIIALDKKTGKEKWRYTNYGFKFQKPNIFPHSISFWSATDTYYLLDKARGTVLYSTSHARVVEGSVNIYIVYNNGVTESVNPSDGTTRWTYKEDETSTIIIQEVNASNVIITGQKNIPGKSTTLATLVDVQTGKSLWTKILDNPQINSVVSDKGQIYIIGQTTQCAYTFSGKTSWCSHEKQNGNTSFLTNEGLYLISTEGDDTKIFYMDTRTGSRKWIYESSNVNTNVITQYGGDLYFIAKDKLSVYRLNGKFPRAVIREGDIRRLENKYDFFHTIPQSIQTFRRRLSNIISSFTFQQSVQITKTGEQVRINEPYELTVHMDDTQFTNKYEDARINATFSSGTEKSSKVTAFYFDKNTWKIRFTPTAVGKWNFIIKDDDTNNILDTGSFNVSKSDNPEFISISKKDPLVFVTQKGNVYIPIGIQDCVQDYNQDGNPLNQWFYGAGDTPALTPPFKASTMDAYLSTFATSGFNMFRWGAENCSFPLWKTLSPSGNRYALDEGYWLDTFFTSLKNHGFHIWMSLFSFKFPFDMGLTETHQRLLLSHYLDYVVARYGAYVDVWELANEIRIDPKLVNFMAEYIRSIDPYHHPITTNWDQSTLPTIDIVSDHWYSQECNEFCEGEIIGKLQQRTVTKPYVFSEQGNLFSNWDDTSAARMRARLWIGYFKKAFYIYWNTSMQLYMNRQNTTQGPSNIYLGPMERQHISAFSSFISDVHEPLIEYPLASDDNVYTLKSGSQIIGYVARQIIGAPQKSTTFMIDMPADGVIRWVNPSTGSVILEQAVQKGTQMLQSPIFSTDIAFKILLSTDTSPVVNKQQKIDVLAPDSVPVNTVYELTLHVEDSQYPTPYNSGDIIGSFVNKLGNVYPVKGFYYDHNTWKLRFVPTIDGTWDWNLTIAGNPNAPVIKGAFTALPSNNQGYISVSRTDPHSLVTQRGEIFVPVGIQDCAEGSNQNSGQLNQIGDAHKTIASPILSLETYLSVFANSGFNVFRWGVGHCSYSLWNLSSLTENQTPVNEDVRMDALFSSLKNHGFHIWMSLVNFSLPFEKITNDSQKQALLKRYLDYIVSRYASYVDIWELANETKLSDSLTSFTSDYIRSIDPYHHPIITGTKDVKRPITFSSQVMPNEFDQKLATQMRMRLWTDYFEKTSLTFFGTSRIGFLNGQYIVQDQSTSHLGSLERQFISVFCLLTQNPTDALTTFPLASKDNVYAFLSEQQIIGYLYNSTNTDVQKNTYIAINIPAHGIIRWISPANGSIVSEQPVEKGSQILWSPKFSNDIVFKIQFSS